MPCGCRLPPWAESELELRQVRETLDKQLNFFQILMDTIPNPIFFKSVEGLYLGCNKAFEAFLGLDRSEIVGKSVYDLAPKELADHYWEADSELFARRGVQVYESSVQSTSGERHDVVFHKATFSGLDGTAGRPGGGNPRHYRPKTGGKGLAGKRGAFPGHIRFRW